MATHPTLVVRLIAPFLVAAALAATPAFATDASHRPVHSKHLVRTVVPAHTDSLDGTLVAPGCPNCVHDAKAPSIIDWLKAQLDRLAA